MQQFNLDASYILHTRPYRNTSVIIELFTQTHGRVSAISRGGRSQKSKIKYLLQPFIPLVASCRGRSDLLQLLQIESPAPAQPLTGNALFCGFYINELLMRLLLRGDHNPELFTAYQHCLQQLPIVTKVEQALRQFEQALLKALGYGLLLEHDVDTGEAILPDAYYLFRPDHGFSQIAMTSHAQQQLNNRVSGHCLLALANNDYSDPVLMREAKYIMRQALQHLLAGKPLHSRQLF